MARFTRIIRKAAIAALVILAPYSTSMAKVTEGNADAKSAKEMKDYTETVGNGKHVMVAIKGGIVTLGSPGDEPDRNVDEGPQIRVKVEPFWMDKHEVTWDAMKCFQDEYHAEIKKNIKAAKQPKPPKHSDADAVTIPTPMWEQEWTPILKGMGRYGGYPAANMSQYLARQFTKWLSLKTGRFYRLPTEAEWEYACRAGTTSSFNFGNDAKQLGEHGIYFDNSEYKDPTKGHPETGTGYRKVGSIKPNAFGLHDMHGNVAEWVIDEYRADHFKVLVRKHSNKVIDWKDAIAWPKSKTAFPHVIRGGSWDHDADRCRSAARWMSSPKMQARDCNLPKSIFWYTDAFQVGFRIVRPLKEPTDAAKRKFWDADSESIRDFIKTVGKVKTVTVTKEAKNHCQTD